MQRNGEYGILYEVGDTVKIKSREWFFLARLPGETYVKIIYAYFGPEHAQFCGKTAKIVKAKSLVGPYRLDIDHGAYEWADDFFDEVFALEQMEANEHERN